MIRIFIFLAIALISLNRLSAQADFRSGYVVLNSGDTLHGLIDFRGYRSRTQRCKFKQDNKAPKQEFYPDEATEYRFTDGKYFISREVTIYDATYRLFLEYLFNGIVDVFYFGGLDGHNYLIESDSIMYLMEIDQTEVEVSNIRIYARENSKYYKNVLKNLFSQSPMIVDLVDKVSLKHNDLIKISEEYHKEVCTNEQPYIVYEKRLPVVVAKYGLITGLSINKLAVNRYSPFYTFTNKFNHSEIPALGVFLSLNFPSLNQHVNLIYEGIYFNRKLQASDYYPYYFILSQHVWQSSLTGRYRFPGSGLKPTVQGGFFFHNFLKNSFHRKLDFYSDMDDNRNPVVDRTNFFKNYHAGLTLGAGLASKKWTVDLRYNYGIMLGLQFEVFTQAFQLNVGYSLN